MRTAEHANESIAQLEPGDLVTLREAAAMLSVDYDTVLSWVHKGVFGRTVRVGPAGGMRLYRTDVLAQIRTEYVDRTRPS